MPFMFSFEHILFQFFEIIAYITLHSCRRCDMLKLTQHGLVVLHCLKYVVYMAVYRHLVKILYR